MNKKTQCKDVKRWLESGYTLTQKDAEKMFGIGRLAARIGDLKHDPYNLDIEREMVAVTKANGTKTRVARYSLAARTHDENGQRIMRGLML